MDFQIRELVVLAVRAGDDGREHEVDSAVARIVGLSGSSSGSLAVVRTLGLLLQGAVTQA